MKILSLYLRRLANFIHKPETNAERFDEAIETILGIINEYHDQEHAYIRKNYIDYYEQILLKIKKEYC